MRVFLARTEPDSREAKPTCWKKVMTLRERERGPSAAANAIDVPSLGPPAHSPSLRIPPPATLFPHLNSSNAVKSPAKGNWYSSARRYGEWRGS